MLDLILSPGICGSIIVPDLDVGHSHQMLLLLLSYQISASRLAIFYCFKSSALHCVVELLGLLPSTMCQQYFFVM